MPVQVGAEAMGKDAAFQIFAKRLADVGPWRVVVALPVELAYPAERLAAASAATARAA